jgi:ribosomal protein S18 acetylase RimI-like enzyme
LSVVAEDAGTVVAFLLCRRRDRDTVACLDVLAVDPDHQRRGIGAALLGRTFAAAAAAGLGEAQLTVASDNPRALRLYGRVGMRPRHRLELYERPLSAAPRRPADPAPG